MRVLDFYQRALDGQRVEEQVFDLQILPKKLRELVKNYDISFNPEEVVPQDLDMARRVYEAAVELLCEVGVYCRDTGSIINIEKEDIKKALWEAPSRHVIGEETEAVECYSRDIGDKRRPFIIGGPNGAPISEGRCIEILSSYVREPIDGLHTGAVQTLFGKEIKAGDPLEVLVCKYEALWAREALRREGKPGLSILGIMSGSTSEAQTAADFEGGLRPSDMHLVVFLNELKLNFDVFKKIIHNQYIGNIIDACMGGPTIGGYSGGPEGSAIVATAEILQGYVIAKPMTFSMYPVNLRTQVSSDKWAIWVGCMSSLALKSAGINIILAMYVGGSAGPCTEMLCDEIAAQAIAYTASGVSTLYGPAGCSMAKEDYFTGMESRILRIVSEAAAGMSLSKANSIVKKLADGYDEAIKGKTAPIGKSYVECYDRKNLTPSKEYLGVWEKEKEKLTKMGLNI